ncbi:hypothetical protein DFH29DRAFT_1070617 [Suillus ampliporus]|nr:hypothetical protein DFH29DRAFT_1070617 [Suillus ampliporus]
MSPGKAQPGEPGSSSTPQRPNVAGLAGSSLKSTPNSRGAATVSDHISLVGVEVEKIRPWIQRDIEQAKTCPVDAMLQVLLQRASIDHKTEQPGLLERCLEAVLPVCNGRVKCAGKDEPKLHSSRIKKALDRYVLPGVERKYYEPFIQVTNIALACLADIKVDGMRAASAKVDILCQLNDKEICQEHQDKKSRRKPDVVILPFQSSLKAFPNDGNDDARHRFETAAKPTEEPLLWTDVLASIEFKRKSKVLARPRFSYTVKNYVYTKPDYLRLETAALDGPVATASGLSQTQSKQPEPAPASLRRSARVAESSQNAPSKSSSKRKAAESVESSRKRPKVGDTDTKLDVTVQTGLYAAEMFAANVAVSHLLNLIVIDDVVWIWYYDRQGTIQCSGINFIDDLPRFMVLLYAFQRFDLEDWGRNKHFKEVKEGTCVKEGVLRFDLRPEDLEDVELGDVELGGVDLEIHTSDEERVTHYGLKGRATNVFPVTSEALAKKFPEIEEDGMVAKIFWGEEQRTSEPEILSKVFDIADKEKETVKGHVPQLLWHCKVKNPTSAVRKALGLADPSKGSRVLYILVFRKLRPITELHGEDFFNVWRQCILCHLALWKGGVHHRDVSPPNMMYYRTKNGVLMGVLNDYDLSSLATTPGPQGNERTGTVPFMALDLLSLQGQRGEVEHLYRHDLESFMWVLAWVCLRYRNGVLLPRETRPLDEWATLDAVACGEKKYFFMGNFLGYRTSDIKPCMWDLVADCFDILDSDASDNRRSRNKQSRQSKAGAGEQTSAGESVQDMDDFLHKFTSTESWIRLSNSLP